MLVFAFVGSLVCPFSRFSVLTFLLDYLSAVITFLLLLRSAVKIMSDFVKEDAVDQLRQEETGRQDQDMDMKNGLVDSELFRGNYKNVEQAGKEPFFDSELSINLIMESKTSNDSLQHSNFLDETDIYNRNIPIAPLTGRDAIWNQIVKDIISAGEKKQKITLGSSTAAAIVDEPQIQEAMQRDEDSRLSSHIFSVLDKVMTLPLMRSLDLRFAQVHTLHML